MMIKNLSKLNTPHQGIPIGVVTKSHGGESLNFLKLIY